ncbi:uncharacterized protein LOC126175814 [Schistocerca cancellata]|uniref:uncharacterized protein LOC126175814 n=1 Tax=Schistocerca cancellata TaxID=274614 RepID=UPI0021179FC0|nr:uncharacterized protein LOC126175814 [Schistocerca cancellata]
MLDMEDDTMEARSTHEFNLSPVTGSTASGDFSNSEEQWAWLRDVRRQLRADSAAMDPVAELRMPSTKRSVSPLRMPWGGNHKVPPRDPMDVLKSCILYKQMKAEERRQQYIEQKIYNTRLKLQRNYLHLADSSEIFKDL